MQLVNLARYAETPENIVSNFRKLKFNLKSLSVYKALSPIQYRLDVQFANDYFERYLPRNRIAKRELGYITNPDKFVFEFDLNLQICIHDELDRIFEIVVSEKDNEVKKSISSAWLPYFRDHYSALETVLQGDEGIAFEAKEWISYLTQKW